MYWEMMKTKYGETVANIATGSATPGSDLLSAANRGMISFETAKLAAKEITGYTLLEAAQAEDNFVRIYNI